MKVIINLSTDILDYIDTTPFVQGENDRNYLEVYSPVGSIYQLKASLLLQNGRNTLPLDAIFDNENTYTIKGVEYNKYTFPMSIVTTSIWGNIAITLLAKDNGEEHTLHKFNVINNVLKASVIEILQDALDTNSAIIMTNIETQATNISNLQSDDTQHNTRIGSLETRANALDGGSTASYSGGKVGNLNTEVFGTSSGGTNTDEGLHNIVRVNHENRLDAIEAEIGTEATPDTILYRVKTLEDQNADLSDLIQDNESNKERLTAIEEEIGDSETSGTIIYRLDAIEDADYQSQIDAINAGQNLADIVADLTALNSLDTTKLHSGDKVQVLVDSNHENASTVYNWTGSAWEYIGQYGQDSYSKSQTYTKTEVNDLLTAKEDTSNKVTSWNSPTDTQYPSAKLTKDSLDSKANDSEVYKKSEVYNKTETYNKTEVYTKAEVDTLEFDGYEMDYASMVAIFNDAYSNDPVVILLNTLNGEVV